MYQLRPVTHGYNQFAFAILQVFEVTLYFEITVQNLNLTTDPLFKRDNKFIPNLILVPISVTFCTVLRGTVT